MSPVGLATCYFSRRACNLSSRVGAAGLLPDVRGVWRDVRAPPLHHTHTHTLSHTLTHTHTHTDTHFALNGSHTLLALLDLALALLDLSTSTSVSIFLSNYSNHPNLLDQL